jgi:hypothetical protein
MTLHAQRENLYLALAALSEKLSAIHPADAAVLADILLEAQLLATAVKSHDASVVRDEHAMDAAPWARSLAGQVIAFIGKLQELYKISQLYLWS